MLIVGERCTVNVLSNPMYNIHMVDDNTLFKSHRFIIEDDTHTIYSPHYSHIAYTDHLDQTFQKTCIISCMISRSTVDCKTSECWCNVIGEMQRLWTVCGLNNQRHSHLAKSCLECVSIHILSDWTDICLNAS